AAGWSLQSGDHPQGSGLAAAGGTQQGDKGVVLDDHAQVVHRVKFAPPLGHVFQSNLRHSLTSYSLVQAGPGDLVHQGVAHQDGDNQNQVDAAGEGVQTHLVEVVQGGGQDKTLSAQQHEQGQLPQAGHKGEQIAADNGGLLNGNDDAGHALDPGDVQDH